MILKEAIISYLELEEMEEGAREEIIRDLMNVSIEKTLDLVMDKMSQEDLDKINELKKDSEKFQEIGQPFLSQIFFDSLNNQIKETLYEFRIRSRK